MSNVGGVPIVTRSQPFRLASRAGGARGSHAMNAAGGKLESRLVYSAAGTVRCRIDEKQVTLALEGNLDHATAAALLDAVTHELTSNPARIDIDLSGITSFAAEGAQGLARCREVCSQLPAGLHYRTEGGAGQLALLAAFEREPLVELE